MFLLLIKNDFYHVAHSIISWHYVINAGESGFFFLTSG